MNMSAACSSVLMYLGSAVHAPSWLILNPVAFATGGGSQPGKESLTFSGSRILDGEEVYVLEECPPAQSIGKAVIDKGYMFIWDPRENVPCQKPQ